MNVARFQISLSANKKSCNHNDYRIFCMSCLFGDHCCAEKNEETDAIVLGLPIYMGQMSARAKIFTDWCSQ